MPDINMQHFGELQRNQHSIDVEIDASQVASPQHDFPMMLETPNSSNSVLNVVAINELGVQLPTEIEGIANDKNWVHLNDLVQSVTNRKMKVFYGGSSGIPTADSTYGSQAVWGSNYKLVYHMNQEPNGNAADAIKDSTQNTNHGTPAGFSVNSLVDFSNGRGISFDGADSINTKNVMGISGDADRTILTIAQETASNHGRFFAWGRTGGVGGANAAYEIAILNSNWYVSGNGAGNDWDSGVAVDTLVNVHSIYHNSGVTKWYKNGADIGGSFTHTFATGNTAGRIAVSTFSDFEYLIGKIGEIRISDISRSVDWTVTEQNNLNNPTATGIDSFYKSISKEHNFTESLQSLGRAG